MFSLPEALWKMDLNPKKVFGNVRQKNQPKNLISPSLIHKNFLLPEFLWNPEEFPKIFSVTWDQSFDRTLRYPPSCPFISSNTRNFLKPRSVHNKTFRYCDWKFFPREKPDNPPRIHKKFSLPEIFWNEEVFPIKFFGIVRQKKTRRENVKSTSLIHTKFSLPEFSWNTEQLPMKRFGIVRRNKSTGKSDSLRHIPKYIRCEKFSETTKSSQRKLSKLWYRKVAKEKRDIPLSHSCNIPATRTFVKHRSVPNALSR